MFGINSVERQLVPRLKEVLSESLDITLSGAERRLAKRDPVKLLASKVTSFERQAAGVRLELVNITAQRFRIERELKTVLGQHEEYGNNARELLAMNTGKTVSSDLAQQRENLAHEALTRQQQLEPQILDMKGQLETATATEEQMREISSVLTTKANAMGRMADTLSSQLKMQSARENAVESLSTLNRNGVGAAFDNMHAHIGRSSDRADAITQLVRQGDLEVASMGAADNSFAQKMSAARGGSDAIANRIAEMKAELGTGGTSTTPSAIGR